MIWNNIKDWALDNQGIVTIMGLVVMFGSVMIPWDRHAGYAWVTLMRGTMVRRARRIQVDNEAIDEFTDKIEDKVLNGEWTRSEATEVYRKLKILFPVRNIFPSTEKLKENIHKRMTNGVHAPVDIPNGKRRHMFSK